MNKNIALLVSLLVLGLAGCAGLFPPLEQDSNAVRLILKNGDKVDGHILDIQGGLKSSCFPRR